MAGRGGPPGGCISLVLTGLRRATEEADLCQLTLLFPGASIEAAAHVSDSGSPPCGNPTTADLLATTLI